MKTYWHQIGAPRKGRKGREEDPFPPNSESLYMHSWCLLSWRKIAFFLAPLDRRRPLKSELPSFRFPLHRPLSAQKEDVNSGGKWVSESRRKRRKEEKGKKEKGLLLTYPTVAVRSRPGKREHIIEFGQNSTSHICTFLKRQHSTHFLSASFLGLLAESQEKSFVVISSPPPFFMEKATAAQRLETFVVAISYTVFFLAG